MAKQRYYLDTRVLTAFFFAAMPFVAFGSFIVVNQAKNQLRESVGVEPRAAGGPDQARPRAVRGRAGRPAAGPGPGPRRAAGPRRRPRAPSPRPTRARSSRPGPPGRTRSSTPPLLDSPLAARLKPLGLVRPSVKQIQIVDTTGRVVAASSRGGRLFYAESEWFKDLSAQEGEPEVHLGQLYRAPGSTVNLLEIAFPVRNRGRRLARGRAGAHRRERPLHGAGSRAHRPHRPRLAHPLDRRHGPRVRRERAHPEDAASRASTRCATRWRASPWASPASRSSAGRDRAGATGRSPT